MARQEEGEKMSEMVLTIWTEEKLQVELEQLMWYAHYDKADFWKAAEKAKAEFERKRQGSASG
jgi:hypothetical protein